MVEDQERSEGISFKSEIETVRKLTSYDNSRRVVHYIRDKLTGVPTKHQQTVYTSCISDDYGYYDEGFGGLNPTKGNNLKNLTALSIYCLCCFALLLSSVRVLSCTVYTWLDPSY